MTRVAFRVDASLQIGTGHVMRCLTISRALAKRGWDCFFLSRKLKGNLIDFVSSQGFRVLELPEPGESERNLLGDLAHGHWLRVPMAQDARESEEKLKKIGPIQYLVVDHYSIDAEWERQMRSLVDQIMVIDDLADREHDCDALIDSSPLRIPQQYAELVPDGTDLMLGSTYVPIRPEFRSARQSRSDRSGNSKIAVEQPTLIIAFGGLDPQNMGCDAIDAIEKIQQSVKAELFIRSEAPNLDQIRKKIKSSKKSVSLQIDSKNIAQAMSAATLAIGAPGMMTWEWCCVGLPGVYIVCAENQMENAKAIESETLGRVIGRKADVSAELIASAISDLLSDSESLKEMSRGCAAMVDGLGAERIVSYMQAANDRRRRHIWLRSILPEDVDTIFTWQNHPSTRKHFKDTQPPSPNEHAKWFDDRFDNHRMGTYIIMASFDAVGLIHLIPLGNGPNQKLEIFVLVSPEEQTVGIAKCALDCLKIIHHDRPLVASVLESNVASARLFESAGFRQVGKRLYEHS